MKCGITVRATFDDESGQFSPVWTPAPPSSKETLPHLRKEYEAWRNQIFEEWANRTGKKVLLISY